MVRARRARGRAGWAVRPEVPAAPTRFRLRPPRVPLPSCPCHLGPSCSLCCAVAVARAGARVREWMQRHAQHEHYNFEYLGRNWNLPSARETGRWLLRATFPFVSTAFTVPSPLGPGCGWHAGVRPPTPKEGARRPTSIINCEPPEPGARASWLRPGADVDSARNLSRVQILGRLEPWLFPRAIFAG